MSAPDSLRCMCGPVRLMACALMSCLLAARCGQAIRKRIRGVPGRRRRAQTDKGGGGDAHIEAPGDSQKKKKKKSRQTKLNLPHPPLPPSTSTPKACGTYYLVVFSAAPKPREPVTDARGSSRSVRGKCSIGRAGLLCAAQRALIRAVDPLLVFWAATGGIHVALQCDGAVVRRSEDCIHGAWDYLIYIYLPPTYPTQASTCPGR